MPDRWTPEPFEDDDGTIPFKRFLDDLSDFKFVALDTAIDRVLSVRGIDLVRTEWLKALGDGLHEFRLRHDADEVARMFGGDAPHVDAQPEKVLLRVFVHFTGRRSCYSSAATTRVTLRRNGANNGRSRRPADC